MSTEKIGLKLADGEFYPVLADGTAARKRLVLTTVQDGQASVQIDLYRGAGPGTESSGYIGSLVIEGIPPMKKGEPDIRMEIGLGEDEKLSAFAEEASTGASQSLEVSLRTLSDDEKYEVPDFEFSKDAEQAEPSFSDEDFADTDELPADQAKLLERDEEEEAEVEKRGEQRKRRPLLIALLILAILLVLGGIGYLVYGLFAAPKPSAAAAPAAPVAQPAPAPTPAPAAVPAPAPTPAPQAAAAPPEAPKPVTPPAATPAPAPAKAAAPAKAPGVWHKVKWGDTLWDLSYAYYRNPWYFARIAKANKIRNPDLIICGHKIWIPKL